MKLLDATEEIVLKHLIDKLYANIVRQNDGYDYLFSDDVYLPVYKYSLRITKRKIVKLNLVEEKVLEIVKSGVYQLEEMAKILGMPRKLLDITLADLHVKDLVTISSDKCTVLQKGEMALMNLQKVEKSQDILKDIYMDALKGSIIFEPSKYQLIERVWSNDNKLEVSIVAEDLKQIKSQFEIIREIFNQDYSQLDLAEGIRSETQELLTIDGIESVYVSFVRIPIHVFVSNNSLDIDIVAAKKVDNELLANYKDDIIQQIAGKQVLKNHFAHKYLKDKYLCDRFGFGDVENLFQMIKNEHFSKGRKEGENKKINSLILSSRKLMDGEVDYILEYLATDSSKVCIEVDNLDDWAYDTQFVGKMSRYAGKAKLDIFYSNSRDDKKALLKLQKGHTVKLHEKTDIDKYVCWKYDDKYEVYGVPIERQVLNVDTTCVTIKYFLHNFQTI